jgi:hypothetical protein
MPQMVTDPSVSLAQRGWQAGRLSVLIRRAGAIRTSTLDPLIGAVLPRRLFDE